MKSTSAAERPSITSPISAAANVNAISRAPTQRTLLSSTFTGPVTNGARAANSLGRNLLSAGDKLRDLIVPESLASVVSGGMWSTGLDRIGLDRMWGSAAVGDRGEKTEFGRRLEKARKELDELLAGACPLCEGVVAGLDRPFVKEGEEDDSWQI